MAWYSEFFKATKIRTNFPVKILEGAKFLIILNST